MKASFWILVFGTALGVFSFHHALRAEEAPPTATNTFLDEGDADYEMPKIEADKDTKSDTKLSSQKTKNKPSKTSRVPAAKDDEDDDKAATGTKGDAFDQMQNPEAAQVPSSEKKAPAKAMKKSEDLSQMKMQTQKKSIASKVEPSAPEVATEAPKLQSKRSPASVQFKQGFKSTKEADCIMYSDADKSSAQILVVKGPKKLWVEQNGDWFKAYHKKGSGFLSAECFE